MEVPNGIKILTMVSSHVRGDWVWRNVSNLDEGKPRNNPRFPHVVDYTNGTHIYAVLAWPFKTKLQSVTYNFKNPRLGENDPNPKGKPEVAFREKYGREPVKDNNGDYERLYTEFIENNNVVPNIQFVAKTHMRLPSQEEKGDYLTRANENKFEIMTSATIPEINASIQLPMRFFSRWEDVINYMNPNQKEYLELFVPSIHDAGKVFNQEAALKYISTFTKGVPSDVDPN